MPTKTTVGYKLDMLIQKEQLRHFIFMFIIPSLTRTHETATGKHLKFEDFLMKMFQSETMSLCSMQLFIFTDESPKYYSSGIWLDGLELLTVNVHKSFETSGIVLSEIKSNFDSRTERKRYQQPEKHSHAKRCSVVIVVLYNLNRFALKTEETLKTALTLPLLHPPTIRNRDKYLILTDREDHVLFELQNSKFFRGLKYKLVLVLTDSHENLYNIQVRVKCVCQYGLCEQQFPTLINVDFKLLSESKFSPSIIQSLFPDQERNFFGHTLRLSTTTKVPQLLELEFLASTNGNNGVKAKRGLYASVLVELSKRLNFTYEIIPSSGNGSTGHALPNGTWVGIIGDTFKGLVDFGFMAAITYPRFQYAEFCAPINFAYIGFVTGPPRKSYTWKAILWPFNLMMWIGVVLTVLVAAKLVSKISYSLYKSKADSVLISSSAEKKMKWSYLKGISFLVRGLLEQCPDIPENSPNSFRTFLAFWLLFCLVCTTVYRSKMVSLLTFPFCDSIPATFDELALAKDFAIDFHYFGNVGYTYFKTSTSPTFVAIYKRMGREPDPLKCLERTLDQKVACIIFIVTFQELIHRNLSDQYGDSPLKFTPHEGAMFPAGVIHEYKAPLSSNFQSVLFPAMESGLIPSWQQDDFNEILKNKNHWQNANNIDVNSIIWGHDVHDDLLRVKNLKGAFAIFVLGIIMAIVSFIVEKSECLVATFFQLSQKYKHGRR